MRQNYIRIIPEDRVVVELSHQLQSRSSGRSFWSGMSSGWKAGGNVTNRWYERHRVAFRRNGQRMNFTVAVDWGQVIGIAVDEAAHIIDISAASLSVMPALLITVGSQLDSR